MNEYPKIPDDKLRAMTDPARNGEWLVSMATELLAARARLARIDAVRDELAQSEGE